MKRIIIALCAAALPATGNAQALGFGSAPQGSIGYNMSSAIAKVMAESAGLQSRVQPYSGSSAVLPLVNSGELDMAVCNVLEIEEATRGEGPYNGRKQANLRVLAVIFPLLSSIFVRNDSPIKSLADLKGKRIPAGFSAQVTLDRIIDAVLANGGVERKDIVPVLVPNVIRGADGTILKLRKLHADYDPSDKINATSMIASAAAKGEVLTGLLYLAPDAEDLHAHLNTYETAFNTLGEKELCPGSAMLEKINAGLR